MKFIVLTKMSFVNLSEGAYNVHLRLQSVKRIDEREAK
jgi:hypothetical protein